MVGVNAVQHKLHEVGNYCIRPLFGRNVWDCGVVRLRRAVSKSNAECLRLAVFVSPSHYCPPPGHAGVAASTVEGNTAAFHVMILTMTAWLMMFLSMNVKMSIGELC